MNDLWEENKKGIITIAIILVIAILLGIITLFINKNATNKSTTPDKALNDLGKRYYEEVYYPYIEENFKEGYIKFLTGKSTEGIKITLKQMNNSIKNVNSNSFIDKKEHKLCDYDLTYIVIHPLSPYGKKDYTMETKLDCNIKISTNEKSGA